MLTIYMVNLDKLLKLNRNFNYLKLTLILLSIYWIKIGFQKNYKLLGILTLDIGFIKLVRYTFISPPAPLFQGGMQQKLPLKKGELGGYSTINN